MKIPLTLIGVTCASLAWAQIPNPPPHHGPPPAPEEIFKQFDTNHDGMLSLDEFKTGHEKMHAMHEDRMAMRDEKREENITERFKKLDKNADGTISKEEAKGMPLADRFDKLDANHDGKLTMDELKAGAPMRGDRDKHPMDGERKMPNTTAPM